jgi:DNA-binding IclR family transcriptional regulator
MTTLNFSTRDASAQAGIQSVEVALRVLEALINLGGPAVLSAIAAKADLAPSQLHRYLVTFVRSGLAIQLDSGAYDLGPTLRRYGIAAIQRMDPNSIVSDRVIALRNATNLTVFLTVWAEAGPTILRWEVGGHHVPITFRLGSTLPLVRSATGRLFLALLPTRITALAYADDPSPKTPALKKQLEAIRKQQLSSSTNELLPDLSVYAVPIYDHQGDLYGAMSLLVPISQAVETKRAVAMLSQAGRAASEALGHELVRAAPSPSGQKRAKRRAP